MSEFTDVLNLLPPAKRGLARSWVGISMVWLPLAANAAGQSASASTGDDGDFIAMRIKAYVTTNAVPPVEIATPQAIINSLKIGSTDMFPDGKGVPLQHFTTSAAERRGHELEFPVLLPGKTLLTCSLADLSGTITQVRITLFGMWIFASTRGKTAL
jgi:hypothetical protein